MGYHYMDQYIYYGSLRRKEVGGGQTVYPKK